MPRKSRWAPASPGPPAARRTSSGPTASVVYSAAAGAAGQHSLATTSNTTVTPAGLRWVNQDSVGYVFLTPASDVTIGTLQTKGQWADINSGQIGSKTNYLFSLDINHGARPTNGGYLYVIVPGIAASAMDAYLASDPVTVNANTSSVQSVTNAASGLTESDFYDAASVAMPDGLTPSQLTAGKGSSVLRDWTDGLLTLSFTMPTGISAGATLTRWFALAPEPASAALLLWLGRLGLRRRRRPC